MFMMLLILLVNAVGVVFSKDFACSGILKNIPIHYDTALKCMKSLSFSESRKTETIDYVSKIVQQYVFKDFYTDSGEPWNFKTDIFEELKQLEGRNDFDFDFDFHSALKDLISKLRDAHFAYILPKCYQFIFSQPFPIVQLSKGEFQISEFWNPDHLRMRIPEKFEEVFPTRSDLFENHYKGAKILKINGEDPFTVLSKYADEECSYSRDPDIRYNRVLKSEWFVRVSTRAKVPENVIIYTLKTRSGEKDVEVPWIALPTLNFTICGLSIEDEINQLDSPMEYFCGYTPLKEKKEKKDRDSHFVDDREDFLTLFEESLRSSMFTTTSSENLLSLSSLFSNKYFRFLIMSEFEELVREEMHIFEINRFLLMDSQDLSKRESSTLRRYIQEDVISDPYEPVPKGYSHVELMGEDEANATHRYFRLYFKEPEKKIALLKVISFMPDDLRAMMDEDEEISHNVDAGNSLRVYFHQLQESFEKMNEMEIEKLVLDVRGNTGGIGILPLILASYLSPYTPISPTPVHDEIYSEVNDYLHCSRDYLSIISFLNQDRKMVSKNWYNGGPLRERGIKSSKYSSLVHFNSDLMMTFMMVSNLYDRFTAILNSTDDIEEIHSLWRNINPKMFEPEDILVLTDGTCGSACGHFIRLIQSNKLGKVVSQGGGGAQSNNRLMDTASFVGASVVLDSLITDYSESILRDCPVPERLKITKPLTNARVTVSFHEFYLWKPLISSFELKKVDTETPSEFISVPADFHIDNNWDFGDDIFSDPTLLQYFEKCAEWEVKRASSDDCPPHPLPFDHAVFGFPCVTGRFVPEECVLRGCERGFYLSESMDKCLEMPEDDLTDFIGELIRRVFIQRVFLPLSVFNILFCSCCGCGCAIATLVILCIFRAVLLRRRTSSLGDNYKEVDTSSSDFSSIISTEEEEYTSSSIPSSDFSSDGL